MFGIRARNRRWLVDESTMMIIRAVVGVALIVVILAFAARRAKREGQEIVEAQEPLQP